ncbi:MAG: hypothetical protein ACRELA_12295 [Candidatus Rokuibacteriota bacterium]
MERVPWWDAEALRMSEAIERSVVRLHLDRQGEFIAIINAIEMQLESRESVPEVVRLLVESLRTLAVARNIEERHRRRLDQRLAELADRVTNTPSPKR